MNPQGVGGTDWTLIGSEDDEVVNSASATAMNVSHTVNYQEGEGVFQALWLNSLRHHESWSQDHADVVGVDLALSLVATPDQGSAPQAVPEPAGHG